MRGDFVVFDQESARIKRTTGRKSHGKPVRARRTEYSWPETSKAFYSKLFQWELDEVPNSAVPTGTYTIVKVGTGTGGGIMKQVPGGPAGWLAYVAVDDIHSSTEKAKLLGGKIMKDVTEISGMGWLSISSSNA
jgi:uncharacterized protein